MADRRRFNLTFDYARQRIILELNKRNGERDMFNHADLRLKREGGAWSVTAI